MNWHRSLADPRLILVLTDLLSEEELPALDRWFSHRAKTLSWSIEDQKYLWDALRRALSRGYGLLPDASTPAMTSWSGFRTALRDRTEE